MTVPNWQPGVYYPIGAKANWHGRVYEVVQPHTSQSDWGEKRKVMEELEVVANLPFFKL